MAFFYNSTNSRRGIASALGWSFVVYFLQRSDSLLNIFMVWQERALEAWQPIEAAAFTNSEVSFKIIIQTHAEVDKTRKRCFLYSKKTFKNFKSESRFPSVHKICAKKQNLTWQRGISPSSSSSASTKPVTDFLKRDIHSNSHTRPEHLFQSKVSTVVLVNVRF